MALTFCIVPSFPSEIQPTTVPALHYTEASILKKIFFLSFCSLYLCCCGFLGASPCTQEINDAACGWCVLIYTFSFILLIYWCTSFLFSFVFAFFIFFRFCFIAWLLVAQECLNWFFKFAAPTINYTFTFQLYIWKGRYNLVHWR